MPYYINSRQLKYDPTELASPCQEINAIGVKHPVARLLTFSTSQLINLSNTGIPLIEFKAVGSNGYSFTETAPLTPEHTFTAAPPLNEAYVDISVGIAENEPLLQYRVYNNS